MSLKVRNNMIAPAFAAALVCSLAVATPALAAETTDDNGISITSGSYEGRISGVDRFGTAVEASKALTGEGFERGETVLLANYLAWSDTLAATPLADVINTTVLYSYADRLESKTAEELERLKGEGVTNVTLVGGEGVLTPALVKELQDAGFTVDRIGGDDRYETALTLAAEAVQYYNDDTSLVEARAGIQALKDAEAAYQETLAAWNDAREVTADAADALVAAQEAVAQAQQELNDAIAGIVTVPGAPTQEELNDLANEAAVTRDLVSDIRDTEEFVNDVLAEYAAIVGTDFQDDTWAEVVATFGSREFSYEITTDDQEFSGTLAELSVEAPFLSEAAAVNGDTTTVKAVEDNLDAQADEAQDAADLAALEYADALAAAAEAAENTDLNEAQAQRIVAAQKKLAAAIDTYEDAFEDYVNAAEDEAEAKAEAAAAAENRPTGEAMIAAQLQYDNALEATLDESKAYPAFLATGLDFADALAAGPAASLEQGVVLLTRGSQMTEPTERYLAAGSNQVAVGGPAAQAAPDASVSYVGADRYETAVDLAEAYFDTLEYVGLASGAVAADAVIGGALVANVDGTLVLTRPASLPASTRDFLSYGADSPLLVVFGGPGAISNGVVADARQALQD